MTGGLMHGLVPRRDREAETRGFVVFATSPSNRSRTHGDYLMIRCCERRH